MTSQERRIKRLHDHVVGDQKKVVEPTNKELKALLDEKGIEYDAKANKETLIKLLEGAE